MYHSSFFITICTRKRELLFAKDPINPFQLSEEGRIATKCWKEIPKHFPHVDIDEFVVMPNHIHGILVFKKPIQGSLQTIIRIYKGAVTRNVNILPQYQEYKIWQRGYHDRRIRNTHELQVFQKYIKENPKRWIEKYQNK